MTVKQVKFPIGSVLIESDYHYHDSFQVTLKNTVTHTQWIQACVECLPFWVIGLLLIRDKIVSFAGLKTAEGMIERKELLKNLDIKKIEAMNIFDRVNHSKDECIFELNDTHLDFKVSQLIQINHGVTHVTLTTGVTFNNRFGSLYFSLIKPFHKLIIKVIMKKAAHFI